MIFSERFAGEMGFVNVFRGILCYGNMAIPSSEHGKISQQIPCLQNLPCVSKEITVCVRRTCHKKHSQMPCSSGNVRWLLRSKKPGDITERRVKKHDEVVF